MNLLRRLKFEIKIQQAHHKSRNKYFGFNELQKVKNKGFQEEKGYS